MSLPPRSPHPNASAERWGRSVQEESLSRLILGGEALLRHALTQYVARVHHARTHHGKGNMLLLPTVNHDPAREGSMRCRDLTVRL